MKKLVVLLIFLSLCTLVSGANRYVSPSGDDANTGTEGSPWRTLTHATRQLSAGDTLYVMAGTYNERVGGANQDPWNDGTAANPIVVTAYGNGEAVLSGIGISWGDANGGLIHLTGKEHWTFSQLTIRDVAAGEGGTKVGIQVGNNFIISECTFINMRSSAVWSYSASNLTVIDCEIITDSNNYSAIRADNTSAALISGNLLSGTAGTGIGTSGSDIEISGNVITGYSRGIGLSSCAGLVITRNRIYSTGTGVSTNSGAAGFSNFELTNNLIYLNTIGIAVRDDSDPQSEYDMLNCTWYNNTLYKNSQSGINFWHSPHGDNVATFDFEIINNIFSENGEGGEEWYHTQLILQGGTDVPAGFTIDSNMFRGRGDGASITGTNTITTEAADDTFRDAPAGDFRLKHTSVARNSGINVGLTEDFAGDPRPGFDGAFSRGAYELTPEITAGCIAGPYGSYDHVVIIDPVLPDTTLSGTLVPEGMGLTAAWTETGVEYWNGSAWAATTGTATFANASNMDTTVNFNPGGPEANPYRYTLTLTCVQDTNVSDSIQIVVFEEGTEIVDAGPYQEITLPSTAFMSGTVFPATKSVTWSLTSGDPAEVTIVNPSSLTTEVIFSSAGTYILTLATDVGGTADTVQIDVRPEPQKGGGSGASGCAASGSGHAGTLLMLVCAAALLLALKKQR